MTLAGAPDKRRLLIAGSVALLDVVLLVQVFTAVNRLIGQVASFGEVLLRVALVAAVVALAVPFAMWSPRPARSWYLVIAAAVGLGLFTLSRVLGGPVPDGAEDVYAIPLALGVGLLAAGSVTACIGVRRTSDPSALARRPHHWR
jgi:hypothetical protein